MAAGPGLPWGEKQRVPAIPPAAQSFRSSVDGTVLAGGSAGQPDGPGGRARPHLRRNQRPERLPVPGWPTPLLTTRGRKSGRLWRTALLYGQDGD
ncbi:nitroreductase/quinone reductase family protein [Protofrankia symbiont of Coriaria ruscifolia]|uniref:nitroreductase/quinone reductase family protein n=1 Tax=Protofrankia symbiont of Coriaria ruscifolia TaxID=1306542 RepID=UPI001A94CDEB